MQLTDRIKDCNGCSACIVGCKELCIKMQPDEKGFLKPVINEDVCTKCNNCLLYCPLFMPVDLPDPEKFYEYKDEYYERDMPKIYRKTLRDSKTEKPTEFAGTLCQIAGLKSSMGDRLRENLILYSLYCDPDKPKRPECVNCQFIK